MFYDSLNRPGFENTTNQLAQVLGINAALNEKVQKWLIGKRHCTHHDKRSAATQTVESHLEALQTPEQKLLYVLLVVSACNHRSMYQAWFDIARQYSPNNFDAGGLRNEIFQCLGKVGWLASPKRYPVSAASAYECNLPRGSGTLLRLRLKVAELTRVYMHSLSPLLTYVYL